jgi:two-component system KDP operon response regulator KdpE
MSAPSLPLVLVIEDEIQFRRLLRLTLEAVGYEVNEAANGQQGLNETAVRPPQGIIIDLGLPDLDGKEVIRRIREWSQVPMLVLTVRDSEDEKIAALDAGADDYLTKPFSGRELLARLRAILRRNQSTATSPVVRFGDVEVDLSSRVVRRAGAELRLTAKEHDLLRFLALHAGRVVTHRQILRELWGVNAEESPQYLWVYMTHLRQKLEPNPREPRYLMTDAGVGYRLIAD